LRLREFILERITAMKLGVNNRCKGNGTGS